MGNLTVFKDWVFHSEGSPKLNKKKHHLPSSPFKLYPTSEAISTRMTRELARRLATQTKMNFDWLSEEKTNKKMSKMTAPTAARDYLDFHSVATNESASLQLTHVTLRGAVESHLVSILVPRRSHQNQTQSDPLLRHNRTLPLPRHHRTELLSELHSDGAELAGHGNVPVCETTNVIANCHECWRGVN